MKLSLNNTILKAALTCVGDQRTRPILHAIRIEADETKTTYFSTDGSCLSCTTEPIGQPWVCNVTVPVNLVEFLLEIEKFNQSERAAIEVSTGEKLGERTILAYGITFPEPVQYPELSGIYPKSITLCCGPLWLNPELAAKAKNYWCELLPSELIALIPVTTETGLSVWVASPQTANGLKAFWLGMPIKSTLEYLETAKKGLNK